MHDYFLSFQILENYMCVFYFYNLSLPKILIKSSDLNFMQLVTNSLGLDYLHDYGTMHWHMTTFRSIQINEMDVDLNIFRVPNYLRILSHWTH
jgi:hypothetical protein